MAGIRSSLQRLQSMRQLFEKRLKSASAVSRGKFIDQPPGRLQEITNFGSNPGNLRMHVHVPAKISESPPLVIALHGCTQTAASYDQGTGWSALADRLGFIVVFPEQQPINNPNTCFSWFLPGDTARDSGEALSIRQMMATASEKFDIDADRVFVTGLSAGGAMASVMLATYPEIFAGGAIIAGLPFGAASSVQEAFEAMFNERAPSLRALGDGVRAASKHRGPWPKISVWHGTADTVVRVSNADHIIRQWLDVQKLPQHASGEEEIGRHMRRFWEDANGVTRVEAYAIAGIGHGVPLATADAESVGATGPFFLEAGISSTSEITRFWGLDTTAAHKQPTARRAAASRVSPEPRRPVSAAIDHTPNDTPHHHQNTRASGGSRALDPEAVIAAAFKAAGLRAPEPSRHPGAMIDPASIIAAAMKAAGLRRA